MWPVIRRGMCEFSDILGETQEDQGADGGRETEERGGGTQETGRGRGEEEVSSCCGFMMSYLYTNG